jgi:hypothetical protein
MHRNGAVPDNPDVLHRPRRAVGVRVARAIALAGRSNSKCRGSRKVVLTEIPSTRTKDVIMKPLPSNTTRTDRDPSLRLLGWIELITGAKVDAASEPAGLRSVTYSGW